jgi:hypothetical protein
MSRTSCTNRSVNSRSWSARPHCSTKPVRHEYTVLAWLQELKNILPCYGDRGRSLVPLEVHASCIFDQLLPQLLCKLPPWARLTLC